MNLSLGYFEIATTLLFILVIANFFRISRKSFHTLVPFEWPLIGMLPGVIDSINRVHDRFAEVHTIVGPIFIFKFPLFLKMNILSSVDPMDMHYIMSKNIQNFPKAPLFSKMFDFMGAKALFNCDGEEWKMQRRVVQVLLTNNRFHRFLAKTSARNIEKGLMPVLDNAANNGSVLDLQDVFKRLTFDTSCKIVTGYDPCSLSLELPEIPFSKALDEAEEAVLLRHAMPEPIWKLLKWMNIGSEKTLKHAWAILDVEIGKLISMKRKQLAKEKYDPTKLLNDSEQKEGVDFLTSYLYANEQMYLGLKIDDNFLRDSILNYMLASRDTTISSLTWFIWLVIIYPETLIKIREEIKSVLPSMESGNPYIFKSEDVNKLTYLHACVNESLRLYPPVPLQLRVPEKPDKLPSGARVNRDYKIIMSIYAMARMKSIWGEDCSEFKPERWITENGGIKHEPSYKYPVFSDGPRYCLGKDMALSHTKMVAATIIQNYNLEMVEGHVVEKNCSIILYMKHGLKVNVFKRWN